MTGPTQTPPCPECAPGAAAPHTEPSQLHVHLTPYGYLLYTPGHERPTFIEEIREAAYRAGYAEAVARLRDDDRYRNWWSADGAWQHKPTGRYWDAEARGHLADYLETVGPDGIDVTTGGVRMAAYRAARDWAAEHRHPQPDDRMVDAVLAAAYAHLTKEG